MPALSPSTLPRFVHLVHVRVPRTERSERGEVGLREVLARLAASYGDGLARAAVLAFMLDPASEPERAAWAEVTAGVPDAERVLEDMLALPHAHRLPWFEHFARRLGHGPVALRQDVIVAARRVITSDGMVVAKDQLRWVALRHLLAGSAVAPPAAAATELGGLSEVQARDVCRFSAFLSQLVPTPELTIDLSGQPSLSQAWYDAVSSAWDERRVPVREGHDIDAALRALRSLQALPWLLRPVLVRHWFDAARALTDGAALHADAADALRLTCALLDSPVPPELGRQYIEVDPARH